MEYAPASWLRGGNAQTLWAATVLKHKLPQPAWHRERWDTPDGDFVDADVGAVQTGSPVTLVVFHGLEGSSNSHYARALAAEASSRDWRCVVPHFRGCSGSLNRTARAYHSGDFREIDWMLAQVQQRFGGKTLAVGVSLGGNALLRWAQENQRGHGVAAIAALCPPLDLTAASDAIAQGFNRWVYTRHFLATLLPKARATAKAFPGLIDEARLKRVRDVRDFDEVVTAPLHGFSSAADYWAQCSAGPAMQAVEMPTLVVNSQDDPFIPVASLPDASRMSSAVETWRPARGGHLGFVKGGWPGSLSAFYRDVGDWLALRL